MTHEVRSGWFRSWRVLLVAGLTSVGCAGPDGLEESDSPEIDERSAGEGTPRSGGDARAESLLYVVATNSGDTINPDMLTAVDANPSSATYGQIIARVDMPK